MGGRTAHQFAQEFVHNIHVQRLGANQKPEVKPNVIPRRAINKSDGFYKTSASFQNNQIDINYPDWKTTGPSVYTYLSNSIKMEIERKTSQKNRDQMQNGLIHNICKTMLSNENAKRIEEKANVLNHKSDQEILCQRLNKEAKERLDKLEETKQRFLEKEMNEHTFVPQINEASRLKPGKNIDDFYAYQIKWDEKVKDNIVFRISLFIFT